ncbi:MAG TPA: hypothetical protein VGL22_00970 [Terracidiphilus sp.]|jgi:hypothetical protein
MATMKDSLTALPVPERVSYITGRMLGVDDFQADQTYHRGRLARALTQLFGTGTVSGLLVQSDGNTNVKQLEIQVTPGVAIDRAGRIIEVPRLICIVLDNWLTQLATAWQNQLLHPIPGQTAIPDPNSAIHDGANLMVDVFATFVPCTRGLTPCFAAEDDYDATDAFSANRLLDSFAMQLALRTDTNPLTPADPWKTSGSLPAGGSNITAPTLTTLQDLLLGATAGPASTPVEYPPGFDATSVFLARILIGATKGSTSNQPPTWDLTKISIDNRSRLFLYPPSLLGRLCGLGAGTET